MQFFKDITLAYFDTLIRKFHLNKNFQEYLVGMAFSKEISLKLRFTIELLGTKILLGNFSQIRKFN